MTVPVEHLAFLQQSDFVPACSNVFSAEERAILARYGRWMEALVSGAITPATPEQQHFVHAACGKVIPRTRFEQIWVKVGRYRNAGPAANGDQMGRSPVEQGAPGMLQGKLSQLATARRRLDALRELVEAKKQEVLKPVEVELAELEARYSGQLEQESQIVADIEAEVKGVVTKTMSRRYKSQIVADIEAEVKADVFTVGHSVRAEGVQVIYYRPRVTWDSKGLARYAETNPEVEQFRKVGQPSVSLRYRI
jgi:hypothetical protein